MRCGCGQPMNMRMTTRSTLRVVVAMSSLYRPVVGSFRRRISIPPKRKPLVPIVSSAPPGGDTNMEDALI